MLDIAAQSRASAENQGDRSAAIRQSLYDAIVEHRLKPGTKLAEDEVGQLFGVSRTVARGVLQSLAFEGLVTIERNRGAFVARPTPEEARQVFVARRMIEPQLVASAAQNITTKALDRLDRHLEQELRLMATAGLRPRREEIRLSGQFHLELAALAGNAVLLKFLKELIARSSLIIALFGRSGRSSCTCDEHAKIVQALRQNRPDQAMALMLRHIGHIEADLDYEDKPASDLREALADLLERGV
ncbi:GntR family transcriptional regulator [Chelatococcus sp. GCM10030263]|uniref:GntR family transcriptional regulator n=1 Tax=Chelatococcus sp. GCM10030263 TaxID=3273387 RepID=UPI0036185013